MFIHNNSRDTSMKNMAPHNSLPQKAATGLGNPSPSYVSTCYGQRVSIDKSSVFMSKIYQISYKSRIFGFHSIRSSQPMDLCLTLWLSKRLTCEARPTSSSVIFKQALKHCELYKGLTSSGKTWYVYVE